MTVGELIRYLKSYDKDLEVYLMDPTTRGLLPIVGLGLFNQHTLVIEASNEQHDPPAGSS